MVQICDGEDGEGVARGLATNHDPQSVYFNVEGHIGLGGCADYGTVPLEKKVIKAHPAKATLPKSKTRTWLCSTVESGDNNTPQR